MRTFRILITEKCNANCKTCFNKNIRCGNEMSVNDFAEICNYLQSGKIDRIKIMGGEPTVHPHFIEIVDIAQKHFDSVNIFTNAINDEIENITLRKTDAIIYNVACLPSNIISSRLLLEQMGGRMFETQISSDCDVETIKSKLFQVRKLLKNDMKISLTLNCVENIFNNRDTIITKWNDICCFIKEELGVTSYVDHNIPYCFFVGSTMKLEVTQGMCNVKCAGLITPSLKLQYCNQSQDILSDIKTNGKFIPYITLENKLREYYHRKMIHNSNKLCSHCALFERKCNGGCFMHKDIIKVESVIKNSDIISN